MCKSCSTCFKFYCMYYCMFYFTCDRSLTAASRRRYIPVSCRRTAGRSGRTTPWGQPVVSWFHHTHTHAHTGDRYPPLQLLLMLQQHTVRCVVNKDLSAHETDTIFAACRQLSTACPFTVKLQFRGVWKGGTRGTCPHTSRNPPAKRL